MIERGRKRREERKVDERRNHRTYGTTVSFTAMCVIIIHSSSRGSCPPISSFSSYFLNLTPLLLPAHVPPTLRQEHADDGMYGLFSLSVSSSHLIITVIHKKYACGLMHM